MADLSGRTAFVTAGSRGIGRAICLKLAEAGGDVGINYQSNHLPPELEQRLTQEATRHGLALDAYTLQLLDQSLPPKDRRTELVTLLQSWMEEGDPEEQQETGEYLIRALDENRLADRQLFPPELKGVTW
jgi:NAD(P)-dependent dehydrogenase (short-subunit alcohol dehydrogenase family)